MKFGQLYQKTLASGDFPEHWKDSAIEYKHLKKCINKIREELQAIGLDDDTLRRLHKWVDEPIPTDERSSSKGYYSADEPSLPIVKEEFIPQLRVLVDSKTGVPLDVTLTPQTKASLQQLAQHEMILTGRKGHSFTPVSPSRERQSCSTAKERSESSDLSTGEAPDARWVHVPLTSTRNFFDLLEPKVEELEALRKSENEKLEGEIMDLGTAVENVVEPMRAGFEAKRSVSHRDLNFWREMFRLYMDKPIFYSETEAKRGALTFAEAKARLELYDQQLRKTGMLEKIKTPQAKLAAKRFFDLNINILRIMHFQEMNGRAMSKILKKFDKRIHLEGQGFLKSLEPKYPALFTNGGMRASSAGQAAGGFANSIARDLHAELTTKLLAVVPQLEDWNCPICYAMAWKPVNLGCCRSVFCIRCIIKLQDARMRRCPMCNQETVLQADERNLDVKAVDFLEKYFKTEAKKRQRENQKALMKDEMYGTEFAQKANCCVM